MANPHNQAPGEGNKRVMILGSMNSRNVVLQQVIVEGCAFAPPKQSPVARVHELPALKHVESDINDMNKHVHGHRKKNSMAEKYVLTDVASTHNFEIMSSEHAQRWLHQQCRQLWH